MFAKHKRKIKAIKIKNGNLSLPFFFKLYVFCAFHKDYPMNISKSSLVLGVTLRKLRVNRHFSQEFVANCLQISRTAYKDWENGKIDFTMSKLERVSQLYYISLKELLYIYPPPPEKFELED